MGDGGLVLHLQAGPPTTLAKSPLLPVKLRQVREKDWGCAVLNSVVMTKGGMAVEHDWLALF